MTAIPSRAASAASGMRWGLASMVVNVAAQLGFTAVMARLLEPAAFGLMAMAIIVMRLFAYASQAGLAAALVQRRELQRRHVEAALGLTLAIGTLATAAMLLAAPLLAAFFLDPALAAVLAGLAPNLLLVSLGALPIALLRRGLRFKSIAVIETLAYILGYGAVGVLLAGLHAGVWALVGATLAQSALTWAMAYALERHSLRPRLSVEGRELLSYGSAFSAVGLLEFLSANLPGAAIGRLLGAPALGVFSRAWLLTNLPVEKATGVVARVLFPLLSQLQGDRSRLAALFLLALSAIGLMGAALTLSIAAVAEPLVAVLLGRQWSAAVPVVEVLSLSVPFIFMSTLAGTVCDATALLALKMRIQLATLLLIAALMLAWRQHGLVGVAWALVAGEVLRLLAYGLLVGRALGCRTGELLRVLASTLATGALAYAVGCMLLMPLRDGPALLQAAAGAPAALLALAAGALLWSRWMAGSGAAELAGRHRPRWLRREAGA
ncbi:oligosaccharide flippase family protein [Variovorax sp. YR752]|uniref:oligosaccharide flippase family protein n=1 Tax=Variovorax sp. YR752 TaxID=1884383 RepID=UPI00313795D9